MKRLLLLLLAVLLLLLLPPWLRGEAGFFWSPDNSRFLAAQTGLLALAALGMMWVLTAGGIDLSAAAIATLGGAAAATWLAKGGGPWGALAIALAAGGGAGALNGAVIALTRLSPVLLTLAGAAVYAGLAEAWTPEAALPEHQLNHLLAPFPKPSFLLVAPVFWLALLLGALSALIMRATTFAVHLRAIGSNESAARLYGVAVGWRQWMVYTLAGGLFGLAGGLQTGQTGMVPPVSALFLVELITAAMIGRVIGRSSGRVWGTLLGAFLIALLRNAAQQAGWPLWGQATLIALALIGALLLSRSGQQEKTGNGV